MIYTIIGINNSDGGHATASGLDSEAALKRRLEYLAGSGAYRQFVVISTDPQDQFTEPSVTHYGESGHEILPDPDWD